MFRFHVPKMACGGCLAAVTKAIETLDPQARIDGDLENRTIAVTSDRSEAALLAALDEAGYAAKPVSEAL
ncbi:heavy-metal-associated domain-containing protein [Microvirga sp. M2]|uniref:heavy-metal-associated domain-containing protein n=1 Tax=Microvirga sp. M2 TaxID=3073270 RepID=UPI0039C04E01